jgi:hypothetical protein
MGTKAIIKGYIAISLLMVIPCARGGSVTIDPDTGWSGYFHWTNGPGPLDGISTKEYVYGHMSEWELGNTEWSIALPTSSVMTFIKSQDPYYPPGDKWALYVDAVLVPWTSVYTGTGPDLYGKPGLGGYFHGDYSDLALSAGTHTLTLEITQICEPGVPSGAGSIQFSAAAMVVPVPGAVLLGAIGISMVGCLGRRRLLGSNSSSCMEVIRHS